MDKQCSACGTEFACAAGDASIDCWCASLPAVVVPDIVRDCECPSCLTQRVGAQLDRMATLLPTSRMLEISAPWRSGELCRHIDFEIEEDKYVFSRWFHLKRGHCCGNRCRNCPYDHVACSS